MALQPLRRREAQSPGTDRRTQRIEVDDEIVRHCYQKMPRALLVAEEQVLGLGARQRRHESLRFLDRHHRRVLDALGVDGMRPQEGVELGRLHRCLPRQLHGNGLFDTGCSFPSA
jgi:hypothetical protein